jgi:hypothetical protein
MTRKSVFVIVAAVILAVIPQIMHATAWTRTYGGPGFDIANCVQQILDGGYILAGIKIPLDEYQIWLIKTDKQGDTLWTRDYGLGGGNWVEQTTDGGYIIAATMILDTISEGIIIKTNEYGDTLWTRRYDKCWAKCVQQTSDGGYIIAGSRDISSEYGLYVLLWLQKINSNGDSLWAHTYRGQVANSTLGYYVQETPENNYTVLGSSGGTFLMKTNDSGDTLWTRTYMGHGISMQQTADGGYIIAGVSEEDLWLLKTDSEGDSLWARICGGPYYDYVMFVQQTSDGGYIIVGETWASEFSLGDIWLVKTDGMGDTLWTRTYGGDDDDWGACVRETSDGGYIIAGQTASFGVDGYDIWLLKTEANGDTVAVSEKPVAPSCGFELLSPIGRGIVLWYENRPEGFRASVFDASGRIVDEIFAAGASGTITWGENHNHGVYFIVPVSEDSPQALKVVLIE